MSWVLIVYLNWAGYAKKDEVVFPDETSCYAAMDNIVAHNTEVVAYCKPQQGGAK